MIPMSIIGMFCEDIRVEKNDVLTLVGLFPDNIRYERAEKRDKSVSSDTFWQGRVCIYVRANFDPDDPVDEIKLKVTLPNDEVIEIGGASSEVIEKSKEQARQQGGPLAGVIARAYLQNIPIRKPGLLRLEATIGAEQRLLAFLNFQEATGSVSATAS
jgi:hypothetical protein